jgi:hypothetical protein
VALVSGAQQQPQTCTNFSFGIRDASKVHLEQMSSQNRTSGIELPALATRFTDRHRSRCLGVPVDKSATGDTIDRSGHSAVRFTNTGHASDDMKRRHPGQSG